MTGGGLEVREVSKSYGDLIALDGLSMEVSPGQIFGFVGPNGAGKTTAMRIIVGLLEADSGEVRWSGRAISREQRRQIGYMPEERGLYPKMRVDQQLGYFGELHGLDSELARIRTREWLERLGIGDRAEDNVEELSLGNQQRVQLAASLIFEPKILVLDEPFSGLDPIGVEALSTVLNEVCDERDVPVIFSSHQLELVEQICDAVAVLKEGSLVASGRVDDLARESSTSTWTARIEGVEDWDPELAGIECLGESRFRLNQGTDSQLLLDKAMATGSVTEFVELRPTLSQIFRTSITDGEEKHG